MSNRPLVLNVSGNDSAGLAGMAMDVRTQAALGVHSASVITANTAQNHQRVISVNPVAGDAFRDQLAAVAELPIKAVKVGLLASVEQIGEIRRFMDKNSLPLILDTVLASSSGTQFAGTEFIEQLNSQLLPVTQLITPNIDEVEQLTGSRMATTNDMIVAAATLLGFGARAVLIKGGHFQVDESGLAQDYFSDGKRSFWLSNQVIHTPNTRGTGCALSAAVASAVALGYSIYDAVVIGKMAISQALRQAYSVAEQQDGNVENHDEGKQKTGKHKNSSYGPVDVTHFPNESIDLPVLSTLPVSNLPDRTFADSNQPRIGLYPIVDRAHWMTTLAAAGVTTLQLRIKDLQAAELEAEIRIAITLARENDCRLFINDHWQLAIKYQAWGVHLGQEDLDTADIRQIYDAGLRLGISTHCHYEVARAHGYRPSYIACGPVYHTTTKAMPWVPQGIEGLRRWRELLDYPLVAIGGINQQRFADVAATGVDGIAMITAITEAEDPIQTAEDFIEQYSSSGNV